MAREMKVAYDATTQRLSWTFGTGLEPLSIELGGLTAEVRAAALVNGFKQTIADAGALKKGSSVAEKRQAMAARIATLLSGKWTAERAERKPVFNLGDVVLAMARVKLNGDVDKANLAIDRYAAKHSIGREEAGKLFAQDELIAAEVTRIERARAPVKFDADEELQKMDEAEEVEEPVDELA